MSPLRRLTAITHFIIRIISEPTKIILLLFSEPVNLHYIVLITINTVDVSSAECQLQVYASDNTRQQSSRFADLLIAQAK